MARSSFQATNRIMGSSSESHNEDKEIYQDPSVGNRLLHGIEEMRESDRFIDVTLLVGETCMPIRAHKLVLCSLSEYFRALLGPNMKEGKMDEITLPHLNGDIVSLIIDFAYSGKIKITGELVQDILETANFLGIESLYEACCNFIKCNLSVANVIPILHLAKALGQRTLQDEAFIFILQSFYHLQQTDDFLSLDPAFLQELLDSDNLRCVIPDKQQSCNSQVQEAAILDAVLRYVEHNNANKDLLPDLLSRVRLPVVSADVLKQLLPPSNVINMCANSRDLIEEALHLGPAHPVNKTAALWQKPRTQNRRQSNWSQKYAGGGHIRHVLYSFDDSNVADEQELCVKGMKLWIRRWDGRPVIGGLEVFYSNDTSKQHGSTDPTHELFEFHLLDEELVTGVDVRSGWLIDRLTFHTSLGHSYGPYGGPGGSQRSTSVTTDFPTGYLACVSGSVVNTQNCEAITNLQFKWVCINYGMELKSVT